MPAKADSHSAKYNNAGRLLGDGSGYDGYNASDQPIDNFHCACESSKCRSVMYSSGRNCFGSECHILRYCFRGNCSAFIHVERGYVFKFAQCNFSCVQGSELNNYGDFKRVGQSKPTAKRCCQLLDHLHYPSANTRVGHVSCLFRGRGRKDPRQVDIARRHRQL